MHFSPLIVLIAGFRLAPSFSITSTNGDRRRLT